MKAPFAAFKFSPGNIGTAGFNGEPFKYIGPGEFIAYALDTGDTGSGRGARLRRAALGLCPTVVLTPVPSRAVHL